MRESYHLGPTPAEEPCARVGYSDYEERAKAEGRAYIAAIKMVLGDPPPGAALKLVSRPHDFGLYWEVVVQFDPDDPAACEFARRCDEQAPTEWAAAGMRPPEVGGGRGRR